MFHDRKKNLMFAMILDELLEHS